MFPNRFSPNRMNDEKTNKQQAFTIVYRKRNYSSLMMQRIRASKGRIALGFAG